MKPFRIYEKIFGHSLAVINAFILSNIAMSFRNRQLLRASIIFDTPDDQYYLRAVAWYVIPLVILCLFVYRKTWTAPLVNILEWTIFLLIIDSGIMIGTCSAGLGDVALASLICFATGSYLHIMNMYWIMNLKSAEASSIPAPENTETLRFGERCFSPVPPSELSGRLRSRQR